MEELLELLERLVDSREVKVIFGIVWGLDVVVEYQCFLMTFSVSMEVGAATIRWAASIARVITQRFDTVQIPIQIRRTRTDQDLDYGEVPTPVGIIQLSPRDVTFWLSGFNGCLKNDRRPRARVNQLSCHRREQEAIQLPNLGDETPQSSAAVESGVSCGEDLCCASHGFGIGSTPSTTVLDAFM